MEKFLTTAFSELKASLRLSKPSHERNRKVKPRTPSVPPTPTVKLKAQKPNQPLPSAGEQEIQQQAAGVAV
jgi:hypothetical protein